jgi:predicted RNA-binding protein associated with RNAse of E/G family
MGETRTISLQYFRPGKPTATYVERLLLDRPEVKVLAMDVVGGNEMKVGKATVFEPGSTLTWFVFPGQWHDIGKFYLADRAFTGWYTNICTPVLLTRDRWSVTDLFLDLWLSPEGEAQWLDVDEFDAAVRSGTLDPELAREARSEQARIDASVAKGDWPPEICRTWSPAVFR